MFCVPHNTTPQIAMHPKSEGEKLTFCEGKCTCSPRETAKFGSCIPLKPLSVAKSKATTQCGKMKRFFARVSQSRLRHLGIAPFTQAQISALGERARKSVAREVERLQKQEPDHNDRVRKDRLVVYKGTRSQRKALTLRSKVFKPTVFKYRY